MVRAYRGERETDKHEFRGVFPLFVLGCGPDNNGCPQVFSCWKVQLLSYTNKGTPLKSTGIFGNGSRS